MAKITAGFGQHGAVWVKAVKMYCSIKLFLKKVMACENVLTEIESKKKSIFCHKKATKVHEGRLLFFTRFFEQDISKYFLAL